MTKTRESFCPTLAKGLHGGTSSQGWILAKKLVVTLTAVFALCVSASSVKAELMIYITDGIDELTIIDNQDPLVDLDTDVSFMSIDHLAVEAVFGSRWDFNSILEVYSNLLDIDGRPNQVLNINFEALNITGTEGAEPAQALNLTFLATFKGNNGIPDDSTFNFFGGARTNQQDGLGYTFVGSYSQTSKSFYTNGFADEDGPSDYVLTSSPNYESFDPDLPPSEFTINLGNSAPKDIVGSTSYSITYGVRITNLEAGNFFGTASEMDYVLPEPASAILWSAVGVSCFYWRRKSKGNRRDIP
jgi:hypothetical protein